MDRLEIASECRIRIGEYVGRNVFLLLTGTSRTPILARNSLVFAFFGDGFLGWDAEEIYESLVENGALGITVAGENCEHRFDRLLNFLSTYRTSYHISTGMFRDRSFYEAAINFLAGSMPAPELFEAWNEYLLIFYLHSRGMDKVSASEIERVIEWVSPASGESA